MGIGAGMDDPGMPAFSFAYAARVSRLSDAREAALNDRKSDEVDAGGRTARKAAGGWARTVRVPRRFVRTDLRKVGDSGGGGEESAGVIWASMGRRGEVEGRASRSVCAALRRAPRARAPTAPRAVVCRAPWLREGGARRRDVDSDSAERKRRGAYIGPEGREVEECDGMLVFDFSQ